MTEHKIVPRKKLIGIVASLKRRGKKIAFTNGCFDILHAGHIEYLEATKTRADILIVAINTDDSVRRLKGSRRPIVPLRNRLRVIAGLACVDYVVSFAEDTPADLIRSICPHVLAKGGDWNTKTIVGAKDVLAHGGKVVSIRFRRGLSSTNIIKTIRDAYAHTPAR
jgi:D-beta-D-heptose 7-phosphate kinase/D-beta-D-heptose 1-phosphate adenosyltransferase